MRRPGFWPSRAALALLRAALWDTDDAARAWRHALATTDLDTLDPGALRLLPLVQRNVQRLGLENPWESRLHGVQRYWWAHNRLLVRLCSQALAALRDAGHETLVLKGVPLGLAYYGDVALRPMSDFDILVRRSDAPSALVALSRLGWSPERRVDDTYFRLRHGVSLHDPTGRTLDFHWSIHEEDVGPHADDEAWASSVPLDVEGVPTRMLAPAPMLVHSLATGAKWAADPAVRWVADATLIVRRGDVDWVAFASEVARRRMVVRSRASLSYLQVAMRVTVPEQLTDVGDDEGARLAERLEHQIRTRRHDHLGELPRYWFAWARTAPDAWQDVPGFVDYLRCAWDLPAVDDVPKAVVRRAYWRLTTGSPMAARTSSQ